MGDKCLTEAAWKAFARGRGLKDAALLKALAELTKADKAGPEQTVQALDELRKQAEALRSAAKADKAITAYLDDIAKAVLKERAAAQQAAKAAAAAAAAAQKSEEEDDSPALLTTQLLPLVRLVRKGEPLPALLAVGGKGAAVLLSRRAISPARRKLLVDYLGVSAGVKFIAGVCLFEENAHTFVVRSQAGGLAKKLKAALLEQTGLRLKVRVRGESPDDVDEDGDDDGEPAADDDNAKLKASWLQLKAALTPRIAAAVARQPQLKAPIAKLVKDGTEHEGRAAYAQAIAAFKQLAALVADGPTAAPKAELPADLMAQLNALAPRIKATIKAQPTRRDEILKLVGQVQALAAAPPSPEGPRRLAQLTAVIDALQAGGTAPSAAKALAVWRDAKETADAQISQLRSSLQRSGDPRLMRIADEGITGGGLNALTGGRMVALWSALMDGGSGPLDAAGRQRVLKAATELGQFIASDRRIALCETNPYTGPIALRGPLQRALGELRQMIGG